MTILKDWGWQVSKYVECLSYQIVLKRERELAYTAKLVYTSLCKMKVVFLLGTNV